LLVIVGVVVALTVLAVVLPWQPRSRTALEPPASRATGVTQPLPLDQPSLGNPASTVPSAPAGPASPADSPSVASPSPSLSPQPAAQPVPPQPAPVQPTNAAPPPKAAPPAPAPAPFSALAGFRCPDTANSGYTQSVGSAGWYLVTGGGWTGDGCQGHLVAMPMSGDPNRDNLNNVVLWWFKMPPRPRCAVEVYVPRGPSVRDAAGAPATYFVYGTTDGSGSRTGQFTIDQVPNQGRWVAVGTYPATTGQLSVRMMSRGVSNADNSHLGGSAVRVNC
jgi:translation initiation factor IF-2